MQPPEPGGELCPELQETENCAELPPCPPPAPDVDCEVTPWSEWNTCSKACGTLPNDPGSGNQNRTREIMVEPSGEGEPCPQMIEAQLCNWQDCVPTPCVESEWSTYSPCTALCGGGNQTRTREIVAPATEGGATCGELEEVRHCNTQGCVPEDCVVSAWFASSRCENGRRLRARIVEQYARDGGVECPILEGEESCDVSAEVEGGDVPSNGTKTIDVSNNSSVLQNSTATTAGLSFETRDTTRSTLSDSDDSVTEMESLFDSNVEDEESLDN